MTLCTLYFFIDIIYNNGLGMTISEHLAVIYAARVVRGRCFRLSLLYSLMLLVPLTSERKYST